MWDKFVNWLFWLKSKQVLLMAVPLLITIFSYLCLLIADMCFPMTMFKIFFRLAEIGLAINCIVSVLPIAVFEMKE